MIEYKIRPGVTASGEPTWRLSLEYANMFGVGSLDLAENSDRAVLERAIEHLRQPSQPNERQP